MRLFIYSCLLLLTIGCKETFDPPYTPPTNGYLVVEGVINSGAGNTTIRLSRSISLDRSDTAKQETGALVAVQGENNQQIQLGETSPGNYASSALSLNGDVKYRLYIRTKDGKEYHSDYMKVLRTPAIDGLRYEQPFDLTLFINTHDPQNNTRYYKWEFTETWEFHSSFYPQLKYLRDANGIPNKVDYINPVTMEPDVTKFTCWQSANSNTLIFGSTAKLSRDSIDLPILTIPNNSWKLSVLYSILVRQHAVSKTGYDFLQRMKKNTESTGTLFDAQPSELNGNIHADSNPAEIVVGFIEVADVVEKRFFIRAGEMRNWGYREYCQEQNIPNQADSIAAFSQLTPTMVAENSMTGAILRYFAAQPTCVDCTLRGTNVKPPFWP